MDNKILAKAAAGLEKPKKAGKKPGAGKQSGFHKPKLHMTIKPTDDNKFIVEHNYHSGSMMEPTSMPQNSTHAPGSLKELLAHVKQNYSEQAEEKSEKEDSPAEEMAEKA